MDKGNLVSVATTESLDRIELRTRELRSELAALAADIDSTKVLVRRIGVLVDQKCSSTS